jgi:hypothetical protein
MRRAPALIVTMLMVAALSSPVSAYLKLGTKLGTRTVTLKWSQLPIRYFITDRGTTGVTSAQLQQTVQTGGRKGGVGGKSGGC